ncbi:MAG: YqaJ viral recombinase family protein [Eubacterium sp.]|nr:YqaJ viral recombinase family protein [Eubacterium sp.]
MIRRLQFATKQEWLRARKGKIGGSSAAAVLGLNPYMTNQELFDEMTGLRIPVDISDKDYVIYGTKAEEHIRALFALDHPEYQVEYFGDNMLLNDKYPFAHASLDGELTEIDTGRKGVFECKTTELFSSMSKEKWIDDNIPDNYYIQVLHYLMVTEYEFVELRAQIKSKWNGRIRLTTKDYHIERSEVEQDIQIVMEAEKKFIEQVKRKQRPALILPTI